MIPDATYRESNGGLVMLVAGAIDAGASGRTFGQALFLARDGQHVSRTHQNRRPQVGVRLAIGRGKDWMTRSAGRHHIVWCAQFLSTTCSVVRYPGSDRVTDQVSMMILSTEPCSGKPAACL